MTPDSMVTPTEIPVGELADDVKAVVLDHAQRIDALTAVGTDIALNTWASQDVPRMEADDVHRLNALLPNLTWGERWDWGVTLAKAANEVLRHDAELADSPNPAVREEIRCAEVVLTRTAENALAADAVARAVAPQRPEDCERVITLLATEIAMAEAHAWPADPPVGFSMADRLAASKRAYGLWDTAASVGLLRRVQSRNWISGPALFKAWQGRVNPPPLFAPASTVPTPGVQADGHPVAVSPDTAPGGPEQLSDRAAGVLADFILADAELRGER